MFSYYGPMHDSVVWQLQLLPKDNYLPRSWQLLDEPSGDRMAEALWQGHSLDDAYTLCKRMYESWEEGMKLLPFSTDDDEYPLYRSICILFESGKNILEFYKLRRELGIGIGDPKELIKKMREIVMREIDCSRRMIPLCIRDKRLGYHSEAEGFKFFPKKLEYRIAQLENLLDTEFPEVEERIEKGLYPLEFYRGCKNGSLFDGAYVMNSGEVRSFGKHGHSFSVTDDGDSILLSVNARTNERCVVCYEFEPLIPAPTIFFDPDGSIDFVSEVYTHHSMFADKFDKERAKYTLSVEKTEDGAKYTLRANKALAGYHSKNPLRLRLSVGEDFLSPSEIKLRFLAKWDEYPDMFIWLIPEDQA